MSARSVPLGRLSALESRYSYPYRPVFIAIHFLVTESSDPVGPFCRPIGGVAIVLVVYGIRKGGWSSRHLIETEIETVCEFCKQILRDQQLHNAAFGCRVLSSPGVPI